MFLGLAHLVLFLKALTIKGIYFTQRYRLLESLENLELGSTDNELILCANNRERDGAITGYLPQSDPQYPFLLSPRHL
jgi:hypothetical protein